MKTKNIYIAQLAISEDITVNGSLFDYYFGLGIHRSVEYRKIKYILVKTKEDIYGDLIGKDLNTNKKYLCEVPFFEGKLFIPTTEMLAFDAIYPDAKPNLSKKKILKMGNYAIQEQIKKEQKLNK